MSKKVLLVTNRRPGEAAGRAEKIASRQRLWADRGWNVELSYVPEPYIKQFPRAIGHALRRVRAVDPALVVTMNNPFHMHLIGYALKRVLGLPWVAEFRDPLSTHPDWDQGDRLQRVAAFVERITVAHADRVCWLDGIQMADDYFETTYPDIPTNRFVKLPPTGFDPKLFSTAVSRHTEHVQTDGKFTITYAGSFYDGWIEPYGFIDGLGYFRESVSDDVDVQADFYGDWNEDYDRAVQEAGVADWVEHHGFVPHEQVVPELLAADVLLHVGGTDPQNRLNIPSKVWDYVGAGRPILGLVDPEFAVARFLKENNLGIVAHPDDPKAVADSIVSLLEGIVEYNSDPEFRKQFSRERNADAFVDVLNAVSANHSA